MEDSALLFNVNEAVATLTLNRPEKRNAFDDKTLELLIETFQKIHENKNIRVLILQSNGEHFCAGADISWMKKAAQYSYDENHRDAQKLADVMQLLYQMNKPTITLVQGSVYGGGIGLVACSDIVLAQTNAQFCFSEVKLGLVPAVVGPYVLHAISAKQATRYMLTAEVFNAQVALTLGLIHEINEAENMKSRLNYFIEKILANGPNAVSKAKNMIHHITEKYSNPISFCEYTTELIARLRASSEAKEGFEAFLNKREANW